MMISEGYGLSENTRLASSESSTVILMPANDGGNGSVRSHWSVSTGSNDTLTSTHMPCDWNSTVSSAGSYIITQQPNDEGRQRIRELLTPEDIGRTDVIERENMYGASRPEYDEGVPYEYRGRL